jgi:hypothetical protein
MTSKRGTGLSVAVVGAGIAGLAAAERLLASGSSVTVIEARHAVGGRIRTQYDFAGSTIERGAEFVHGRHPGLVARIREAGLRLDERRFAPVMLQDGKPIEQPASWDRVFSELANPDAPDVPIAVRAGELLRSGTWTEAEARRLRRYVEGYMAADVERVSARALAEETRAGEAIGQDGNASIREGYDALVRHMARALEGPHANAILDTAVTSIEWTRGAATLGLRTLLPNASGTPLGAPISSLRADRVIVTIPLGLLQATPAPSLESAEELGEAIVFSPPVASIVTAARRLAMGNVVKLFLHARAPLHSLPGLRPELASALSSSRFLQTPAGHVPTWWRIGCDNRPVRAGNEDHQVLVGSDDRQVLVGSEDREVLVGWTGGAAADRLSGRSEAAIVEAGIETLSHALELPAGRLRDFFDATAATDWKSEPWARGAYSWIPAGALDAPRILATPVEQTLFFAGEATDTAGYRGTVHGALETGLRAADQVLETAGVRASEVDER